MLGHMGEESGGIWDRPRKVQHGRIVFFFFRIPQCCKENILANKSPENAKERTCFDGHAWVGSLHHDCCVVTVLEIVALLRVRNLFFFFHSLGL